MSDWKVGQLPPQGSKPVSQAPDVHVEVQELDMSRYGEDWEPHGFYRIRKGTEGDFDFDHDGDQD